MKNLSQFKKAIKVGTKLYTIHHMGHTGLRDENNRPIYKDMDNGIREVSISQNNSFTLKTKKIKEDGTEKWTDSWLYYPKAADCGFIGDNTVVIWETNREGEKYKVLTYKVIEDSKFIPIEETI